MKYYETTFDEYVSSCEKNNLHEELNIQLPDKIENVENLIFYGPSGIGKYTQVLKHIKKYSPTQLKYQKKITITTEKQEYIYPISDIHYEIDMALLGCNSKTLWHEIFYQIVDIISIKETKVGFIVCKNFHETHNELLDIFYSYIQQYNNINAIIKLNFILITESVSFLPNDILNSFTIINIQRPNDYTKIMKKENYFEENMKYIENKDIMNIKEMNHFSQCKLEDLPSDIFNIICDNIIDEILGNKDLFKLREKIYDILVYNLNATECIYYIFSYFINNGYFNENDINEMINKLYIILMQYNNNYRPIYHLETIFVYMIIKLK
tara:strand:+ start:667 stop:1638 length:972 start_codon:yes stop_codon:yes gene_type:complete